MKFSVLIPVYNVEAYLDECIQSVLSQTVQDYEIILVDDGSTDRSGIICDKYAESYEQIRVFHKPNSGSLHTRIYGMNAAKGNWYVFLDSDDKLASNALEVIERYTDSSDCIIYGYERVIEGTVIQTECDLYTEQITDKSAINRKFLSNSNYNALWRKAVKASCFDRRDYSSYYHISLGEDLLQSLEILENSSVVTFIPDILYYYRVNPKSLTQSISYEKYAVDFTVREKVLEFLEIEDVFCQEDYDEYRNHSLNMNLIGDICKISRFDTSFQNKILLLRQLGQEDYYIRFLSKGYSKEYKNAKNKTIFWLFKSGLHRVLLGLLRLYYIVINFLQAN